jgi:heptosyltransferase III
MKILVLQTARLGDILQTWPVVRALRRKFPTAHLALLVRQGSAGAVENLAELDQVIEMPTQDSILGCLELVQKDSEFTADGVQNFVGDFFDQLMSEKWDQVFNLSFSPVSSHLTKALAQMGAVIAGYSRTTDGYLALPDAMSAYFYAQVGVGHPNRFHLCELFASVCALDLIPSDWASPMLPEMQRNEFRICVHVGASEVAKSISVSKWISVLVKLRGIHSMQISLIGGAEDFAKAEQIRLSTRELQIDNHCGKMSVSESMAHLRASALVVGPDSSPMHMASLVGTPCLNLSVGPVKYFETGPRSIGSVILSGADESDLASDKVAELIIHMVHQIRLPLDTIQVSTWDAPCYQNGDADTFEWKLTRALYLSEDFPAPEDLLFMQGIERLIEVNQFMIEAQDRITSIHALQNMNELFKRGEEVIETIGKLVPAVVPLVRWYMTEKLRIGPGDWSQVLGENKNIQKMLMGVLNLYKDSQDSGREPVQEL